MYRIISGKWKGRRIVAPKNFDVRPTTDFAKEGLFNMLGAQYDLHQIKVLDLFAGIGSISFEFASRGAEKVVSVDENTQHCKFIESQIEKLEAEDQMSVVRADVFSYLKRVAQKYDIVFADPPFDMVEMEYETLHDLIFNQDILNENGSFILEHQSKLDKSHLSHFVSERKYGNVKFSFFGKDSSESEE